MEFLTNLFDISDYPARWNCGNWGSFEGWLHIVSDTSIWAAYFLIPVILFYFKRISNGDLPKPVHRMIPYFMAFIFFCGTTHLIDAAMFYYPAYRFLGVMKAATALISWATVLSLIPVMPKFLKLRTGNEVQEIEKEVVALKLEKAEVERLLEMAKDTNEQIKLKLSEVEKALKGSSNSEQEGS